MGMAYKKLAQGTLSGNGTDDTLYTVPAATSAVIKNLKIVNYSAGNATIKIWHDGVSDNNIILPTIAMGAGEFAEWGGTMMLETGDTIKAESDTSSAITYTIYGVEMS